MQRRDLSVSERFVSMSYGSEALSSQPGPWAGTNPRFGGRASQHWTPKPDEDRPAARSQAWATRGNSRGLRLTLARRCKHARNAVGDCSGAGAVYHHACNRICRQISREPCHSSRARGAKTPNSGFPRVSNPVADSGEERRSRAGACVRAFQADLHAMFAGLCLSEDIDVRLSSMATSAISPLCSALLCRYGRDIEFKLCGRSCSVFDLCSCQACQIAKIQQAVWL